jgi:hypothetical protein
MLDVDHSSSVFGRHFCAQECETVPSENLSDSSVKSFLPLDQQSGNDHQVIRKYTGSDQEFELLPPFGKTTLHAASAESDRNSSFNARTKSLAILKARAFLVGCPSRRFLPPR